MSNIYFQPILSDKEWENAPIFSFQVYRNKDNAIKDFPNNEIGEYRDDDIEEPTFID